MNRKSKALSAAIEALEIRRLLTTLVVNGSNNADVCKFEVDSSFIYATMNGFLIPQPVGAYDDVQINLMGGDDLVTIVNTGDEPVDIDLGSGTDIIRISTTTHDLDSIDSRVFVAAGSDGLDDHIEMQDYNDVGSDDYLIDEPGTMRLRKIAGGVTGPTKVLWGESNMDAAVFMNDSENVATIDSSVTLVGPDEQLSITGGEIASGDPGGSGGDDTVNFNGTIGGTNTLFFHGGSGIDVLNFNTNSVISGNPLVEMKGGSGIGDTLNITDPRATAHYVVQGNSVDFFEAASQILDVLQFTDVVNINSTHATQGAEYEMLGVADGTDVSISGGAGDDTMLVGDNFITTEFGASDDIFFNAGAGIDSLVIHDGSQTTARTHTFAGSNYDGDFLGIIDYTSVANATLFSGVANDTINDSGSSLISGTLTLNGNSGADTFNITPDLTAEVDANGGAPTTGSGDTLNVNPGSATNGTFTSAGSGNGTFDYASRSPIVFTSMENFPAAPTATPVTPNLNSAQDSGLFNNDDITNLTSLSFTGTGAPSGVSVKLFRGSTEVASAVPSGGAYTFSNVSFPTGDDTFLMTARYFDATMQLLGPVSAALLLHVDTVAPANPTIAPDMTAGSDSGVSSTDNITNDTTPTFTGTSVAGDVVRLFDGATLIASDTGLVANYSFNAPSMSDGSRTMTVRFEDVSGNQSGGSPGLSITIDTVAPAALVAPDLTAGSDSGVSSTDNITNDTTPTFSGTTAANEVAFIFDNGTQVGTEVDVVANYSITTSALANGTHSITAKRQDLAGNLSLVSPTLSLQIDRIGPSVTNPKFNFLTPVQSVQFTYSENVSATLANSDLTLNNGTSNIPSASIALSYTPNVATFTFPGFTHGMLPNGSYTASILGTNVTDIAGNFADNASLNFSFLQGDADGNGVVDFDDYSHIDNGFNNNLTGFGNGDFDYNGIVDFDDYSIIDQAFNNQARPGQTVPPVLGGKPGAGGLAVR